MVARLKSLAGIVLTWDGTEVAGLSEVGEVPDEWNSAEEYLHDTPGYYPEQILTNRKGGEITITGIMLPDDAGQEKMLTDYGTGTSRAWTRTAPDGSWEQSGIGYVKKFQPVGKGTSDVDKFEAIILIDGEPSLDFTESTGLSALSGKEENTSAALTFAPVFAAGTTEYNVTVNTLSTHVLLTVTAAAHDITINGVDEATGVESDEIDLGAAGSVTEIIILAKEDGAIAQRTIVNVARDAA